MICLQWDKDHFSLVWCKLIYLSGNVIFILSQWTDCDFLSKLALSRNWNGGDWSRSTWGVSGGSSTSDGTTTYPTTKFCVALVCWQLKWRLGLFGHVARFADDVPANRILRTCCEAQDGARPLKSDTVAVLAVLPRYPWYYRGIGYNFYGITAVLGQKYAGFPWGWGSVLWYYRGYGVEFFLTYMKISKMRVQGHTYIISFTMPIVKFTLLAKLFVLQYLSLAAVFISRPY